MTHVQDDKGYQLIFLGAVVSLAFLFEIMIMKQLALDNDVDGTDALT